MSKMVFVPLTDELIYEHPEWITGPVRAFDPAKRQTAAGRGHLRPGSSKPNSAAGNGRVNCDPGPQKTAHGNGSSAHGR